MSTRKWQIDVKHPILQNHNYNVQDYAIHTTQYAIYNTNDMNTIENSI